MTRRGTLHPAGFSLVEVLIAVLVLSLGLLGLGAVFPTVLRQQRIATESTLGLSAQNAVMPILESNQNFRPGGRGWMALRRYVENEQPVVGDWVQIEPEGSTNYDHLGSYILEPAPPPWDTNTDDVYLPLAQRLYPLPYSTSSPPRFVWDIAARLTGDPSSPDYPYDSPLMVAVFIRSIDSGIKTNIIPGSQTQERYSLAASFVDLNLGRNARRTPVAVDRTGAPTFNGLLARGARYGSPILADIILPGTNPDIPVDWVYVDRMASGGTDDDVGAAALAVPGQRFVDRSGQVHMVHEVLVSKVGNQRQTRVNFNPPVAREDVNGDGTFDQDDVGPIMYLPHLTLVDPYVFTVNP